MQVDRSQLAELLEVTQTRVAQMDQEGWIGPLDNVNGRKKIYDLGVIMRTFYSKALMAPRDGDGGVNPNEARARKDTAQAKISELNLKRQMGELLDRAEMLKVNSKIIAAARALFLLFPSVWSDRLHKAAKTKGPSGVEKVLTTAVDEALTELSGMEVEK